MSQETTLRPAVLVGRIQAFYFDDDGTVVGEETVEVRLPAGSFGDLPQLVDQALAEHQRR